MSTRFFSSCFPFQELVKHVTFLLQWIHPNISSLVIRKCQKVFSTIQSLDNDFAIKSKYHRDLCYVVFNSSYLEFTRCYYSGYVLCFILSNCLLVKVFEETQCNISCADGKVIATPKKVGCLYYLDFQPTSECSNAMVNERTKPSNEMLWHQRYGHLGVQSLKKLANDKLVEGFNFDAKKNLEFCEACTQGKLHRCSFPTSGATRASEPLGLVHSDLCGKINTKSCGGAEYFLTFTDDKTRYVWVYPLKQKGHVFNQFLEWKAAAEKSSGHKLKTLRTDNGGEFTSTEFENYLKTEGVKHELTVPKTPEQLNC